MHNVTYTHVAEHRNAERIWLAGSAPAASGFSAGARYNIRYLPHRQTILLDLAPDGARKVSQRDGRPVIDINNRTIGEIYGAGERVQVVFMTGQIIIQRHHEETAQERREIQWRERLAAGKLEHASMFTGGGVSTEAIHQGIKGRTAWIAEMEHKYIESARANCLAVDDDTLLLQGNVCEIESRYYSNVDLLSFSMPCTAHSLAGKASHKRNAIEYDGVTIFPVISAIKSANPAVIVSENVPQAQDHVLYELLRLELDRLGYTVFEQVLSSAHTDSIENRSRYWLVAFSNGIAPASFELPEVQPSGQRILEILEDVPDDVWQHQPGLNAKAERDAAAGKGFARQLLTGSETRCGTIGRGYMKRRSTEPFLTRPDGRERLFTPTEHCAVKGAPAHLVNNLSATVAHEILGQSVDYRQPLQIARAIIGEN